MSNDKLFGQKGIDTEYERAKITYKPNLKEKEITSTYHIHRDKLLSIERSLDFTIAKAIMDYRHLIRQIDELLQIIEDRNITESFGNYKSVLQRNAFHDVIENEGKNSGYNQTGDYEIYTVLYRMKRSLEARITFIEKHYASQISTESDMTLVEEAEKASIKKWEELEISLLEAYEESNVDGDNEIAIEHQLETLEANKRALEVLHTSLADTGYVHRNRYMMFQELINQLKFIVHQPQLLIDGNMKYFMMQLSAMGSVDYAKSHLILSFKKAKDAHQVIKGKQLMIDDQKEEFVSQKGHFYQQIQIHASEPIKSWLYGQEDNVSPALDKFAHLMVQSVESTGNKYSESLADMLNFYRNEAVFYGEQISHIQKKEEIRLFLRIIEDLEEVKEVTEEWANEYLKANGYAL